MSGARERVVGATGYGNTSKDPIMKVDPGRNPQGLIDRVWSYLFGKKKSTWSAADEAKDEAARRRVAEHDRQYYEGRK